MSLPIIAFAAAQTPDMLVADGLEELAAVAIDVVVDEPAIPGPGGHVGDGIFLARQVAIVRQVTVEHVELALGLHGERSMAYLMRNGA